MISGMVLELGVIHARHLAGGVVGADVGDLMGHHAGHLRLFVGIQDQPEFT